MTPASHLSGALRAAQAGQSSWDCYALRAAADALDSAVAAFDPEEDLLGGLKALNGAVARAERVFTRATGKHLAAAEPVSLPTPPEGDDPVVA